MSAKLIGLPPILPMDPKVLILGSMPSDKSLEYQQYYGNPRNHFWDILFELFDQAPVNNYHDKIEFVKKHHVALWDTIGSCYREGSLDSKITDEEPNDITELLETHPTIRLIACNGTKSFQTFKKYIDVTKLNKIDIIRLPSTSPIPGRYTKTFAGKVEDWKVVLEYL